MPQALAAEKEAIAHEKEMEVARLQAMQEKQADHQSEQDELRARRYQVGHTWVIPGGSYMVLAVGCKAHNLLSQSAACRVTCTTVESKT